MFVDGQPIDSSEQEPLLRVLYALRRCPPAEIERWARGDFRQPAAGPKQRGAARRGLSPEGVVSRVVPEQPPADAAGRYQMQQYYRCEVLLAPSRQPAIVLTPTVPKAWPLNEEFSERIRGSGLFLKLAPGESEETAKPVFAAQRLAWHAEGLLGDLGMDSGLFDTVQNKAAIGPEERECFYQLLAAVGQADPAGVISAYRAREDDSSVVPLFNEPDQQHGKLFALYRHGPPRAVGETRSPAGGRGDSTPGGGPLLPGGIVHAGFAGQSAGLLPARACPRTFRGGRRSTKPCGSRRSSSRRGPIACSLRRESRTRGTNWRRCSSPTSFSGSRPTRPATR